MTYNRYIFLDRDGTIIKECNYLSDPSKVELLQNAAAGLRGLRSMGFGLFVISNQSGIGRGYFSQKEMETVNLKMSELLEAEGVHLDGLFFCPHSPEDGCTCRKPLTGMLSAIQKGHKFNLADCYVVGDKPCDIEFGLNAGIVTFLVLTGYGKDCLAKGYKKAHYIAVDLLEVASLIKIHGADKSK